MNKVLFTASIQRHITSFHIPYLKFFKDQGYEVHVATNGDDNIPYCDKHIQIPFERNPLSRNNFKSYKELKRVLKENKYDLIHCHTPACSVITRLAAKKNKKKGTKVVYTAHGFHFYKGAPLKNWIIFFPIEKYLSKYTDCLITINDEDYNNALKYKFRSKMIRKVNGVGINCDRFKFQTSQEKNDMRQKHSFSQDDFILIYVAELSSGKNQEFIINVSARLEKDIPDLKVLFAGSGKDFDFLKEKIAAMNLDNIIYLLGYRDDVNELMMLSDIAVSASKREGLPVNIMEAMATGLPLVVTDCRGNRDLVEDGLNGYVVKDEEMMYSKILEIYNNKELRDRCKINNQKMINKYTLDNVTKEMAIIYNQLL